MQTTTKTYAEICFDLPNSWYIGSWIHQQATEEEVLSHQKELGYIKCKKSEAERLIVFGERPEHCHPNEHGVWKKGVKNIWLKKQK